MTQFKKRYIVLIVIFSAMFAVLIFRLADMQLRNGQTYYEDFQQNKSKELRLTSNRGSILDANGVVLAYDQKSYDVKFYKDPSHKTDTWTKTYTKSIIDTIEIIERTGGKVSDTLPIHQQEDGTYSYFWGDVSDDIAAKRTKSWLSNMGLTEGMTATEAYQKIYARYFIPQDTPFEQAYKILSVWQDIKLNSYTSYNLVDIAKNVDMTAVAEIEMKAADLPGMQIVESTTRIYPKSSLAAHIIGYMGRMMDEDTIVNMTDLGYNRNDYIGITGIEATMEMALSANLTNRTGSRKVEVDSTGRVTKELDVVNATSGNDVYLTIDVNMQRVLEKALAENIAIVQEEEHKRMTEPKSDEYPGPEYYIEKAPSGDVSKIATATGGAAIVMEVNTGRILAMASNPSYDLNLFTGGISQTDYDILKNDAGNPLLNRAIGSANTPGSIFKMATGLAGLMEGAITVDTKIDDEGPYTKYVQYGHAPSCWTQYPSKHLQQDIVKALQNSCNYYFFTVADKLGIEKLYDWASKLGLTTKTNVELTGEATSQMASQDTLYNPDYPPTGVAGLVYRKIRELLVNACESQSLQYDDEVYDNATLKIMSLVTETETGPEIRNILRSDLKLPQAVVNGTRLYQDINDFLVQVKWTGNDTILSGIGQSVTLLTPIAVARYISAVVNGGNVYEATLIDSIVSPTGEVVEENRPQLIRQLDIPDLYVQKILEGMQKVVDPNDNGTAAKYFANFEYFDQIGGKTGTAQVSDIDIEDNAWFVAFAPRENPQIAIVVCIPNGYSGGLATYTAREFLQYYFDNQKQQAQADSIPQPNTMVE